MATVTADKMTRNETSAYARQRMNDLGLSDWHLKLTTDLRSNSFLGKCSYREKTIYLNAHHLDIHGDAEVKNTINHEIAHALMPGDEHGAKWAAKAKELGCTSTSPCATYGLDARAIDAIRSGDLLEIEYDEQIVRTPKYKVTRYQDKCEVCGKVAKEVSSKEFRSGDKLCKLITFECGHIRIVNADSQSAFDLIVSNAWKPEVAACKHVWDILKKTECTLCGENRLYPFQVEGARFLEKQNGKAAVFDEQGLGKTIQALAYLKFHPECFPVLFIVKANCKYQWMSEIVRWLGEMYFPQILSDGKTSLMPGLKCYIASYDLLRRFDTKKLEGIKTVVLDEVQSIKNPDATRTGEVRKLCKNLNYIIPLSGTPWKNRGSEFFVVLNMLDPKKFWGYQAFINQWVDKYWDGAKEKEGGIRAPLKFKEYIKDLAIRRERAEVMPELPLINRVKLNCEIDAEALKRYEEEVSDFVKFYNNEVIGGTEDSFKTNQGVFARLNAMRQILGIAKIPATMEYIEEFMENNDRKLAVFVHHVVVGQMIYEQCKELGYEVVKFDSSMDAGQRMDAQERFKKLDKAILVASTLASGEGLNLQTCADCIMHERQWNPANEEQVEGRFIRIGQKAQSVNAIYVHAMCPGSTDPKLDEIVERKRRQFHNVMNKGMIPQWNEQSIMKELAESIVSDYGKRGKK